MDIIKLQKYISSYITDENFCWKNGRKEDEAIQKVFADIREIIELGDKGDLTEMHQALGYYGDIDRAEAILLGAYDGFDVRELIGDKYCPCELSL